MKYIKRLLKDVKQHPFLHFISLGTISVAISILGLFLLLFHNISLYSKKLETHTTGSIYLDDTIPQDQVLILKDRILALPGITKVTLKSKEALVQELARFFNSEEISSETEVEFIPPIFEIEFKSGTKTSEITELRKKIAGFTFVREVDFLEETREKVLQIKRFIQIVGVVILVSLLIGCSLIIANFTGMRLQARRNEVDIATLHGAGFSYLAKPLFWEGLTEGLAGAILALLSLAAFQRFLNSSLSPGWIRNLGIMDFEYFSLVQIVLLLLTAILMALVGTLSVFFRFQEP